MAVNVTSDPPPMAADETIHRVIAQTAESHMRALLPKTPGSNDVDGARILRNLAPQYQHDFGYSYFVSTSPQLREKRDGPDFVSHMSGMATALQTWDIKVTKMCVDEQDRTAVIRADFHMTPKGGETIVNDIVFWMSTDQTGRKIVSLTEFVDPVASTELLARMKAGMAEQ